ncbi:hypothetical protein Pcinc_038579 [Petrolisthes cinctipes]|uniref:Uncharacterized protein n=1 Tax=Petrolisthes cinctipes TaxID=88211 RepID=A0AAE1BTD1_PETCI|nr:hypothetical protein Pcinc_038579 [Petrolisthes cinctipes]
MRAAKSLIVVKSVLHHDGVGSGCSCGVAAQARQYGRLARYGRNADPLVSTVTPQAKHVVWFGGDCVHGVLSSSELWIRDEVGLGGVGVGDDDGLEEDGDGEGGDDGLKDCDGDYVGVLVAFVVVVVANP